MNPLNNLQYDLKSNRASDIITAKQLADQAIRDPSQRHAYFDFLKGLREKKGPEYSTAVHQYASKLMQTDRPDIYPVEETIVKTGSQYELKSKSGKNLGKYPTRAGAEKREQQVNYFKHANEDTNPTDSVTVDIPLLIRLLEYAREDAKTDMDLHNVTEKLIELSTQGDTLTMQSYDAIVGAN